MNEIQHFSHRHPLYGFVGLWWPVVFTCGMCNQPLDRCEVHYECRRCDYQIHTACAELPELINNSLHGTHSLNLLKRSSLETSIRCFYCDKSFGNEFAYTCKECAFYMHAKCGVIPQPTIACDDHGVIQFSCHQHPMPLVVEHGDGEDIILGKKCIACQLPCSYPAYSCTTYSCLNFFHKSCVDKLSQKIQHPFHSHKHLTLEFSKPQSCDLCYKKDCRLVFSCHEIGCTFKVCTECAFLDAIIVRCRSHDHLLCLVEGAYFDNIKCDACQKSSKELNNHITSEIHLTRSFLFRCMECDFNLHFICGPLPSTIKFNYHIHSLTLLDSVVEDNCREYYCDVCEEEINPDFRVYNCPNCQYEAHIHCLIPQIIMKLMKGDNDISNDVEFWALGENRWNWTIAIGEKDYNNTHKETLGDLMSCLTQEEKEKLLLPWPLWIFGNLSDRINRHNNYKNGNSRFHQLGRSIEDFETITEFFQKFDSLENGFGNEIGWYVREEGISKVEDKYLRQEVMEVDGKYKVPKTLAPILKTLLDNYYGGEDLGGRSSLSPAMRSVCATILLIVIDKMCRTKIEDVTWDELKEWNFYLHSIYWITHFKVCEYFYALREKFIRDYWSFKVIRCKQDSKNQINAKIEFLKTELKRWEENLDKLEEIDMNEFLRTYALPLKKMTVDEDMDYSENLAWHLKYKTVGDRFFEDLDEN